MNLNFRTLKSNEIEVKPQIVKENGFSLLLYKNARVDMELLDEVVGPLNWQRKHSRDNANCIVSIYDEDKKIWVEKEDTGTESFTEKEKGLASDSFKRACFNWGIGRELYSAPSIWINESKYITKNNNGKPYYYVANLPKPTNIRYTRKIANDTGMTKEEINKLSMKSRTYFTRVIKSEKINKNIGILVIESINEKFNVSEIELNRKLEELSIPYMINLLEISSSLKGGVSNGE